MATHMCSVGCTVFAGWDLHICVGGEGPKVPKYQGQQLRQLTSYINFDAHNYHFLLQLPKPVFISPHDPQLPDLQETAVAIQENSYFVQGPPQAQASLVRPVQARIRRDPTAFHESLATTPPGILSNRSSTSPQFPLTKAPFVHPIDVQFHNLSVGTASAQRTPAPRLPSSQRCKEATWE